MIKNFKKEVNLISSNDKISEKLMTFSLYNEFYNEILGNCDEDFIKDYIPFVESTFELVVLGLNLQEKVSINAEQFMKIYFVMLKRSKMSSIPQSENIISNFENKLNDFIVSNKYVNIIDQFESIPLDAKVDTMIQFREYINDMCFDTISIFGEESSKDLRYNILDMLSVILGEYLKNGINQNIESTSIVDNLKPVMMVSTKKYLMNKLSNGEIGFESIQDDDTKNFLKSHNELEKNIWLMGTIYIIAGYDKDDKLNNNEKMEEICEYLGISKFKYMRTTLSMGVHFMKNFIKVMKDVESDDYLKKKKF